MDQDYDTWTDLEETVHRQHDVQVKLAFPRHYQFMRDHGLDKCEKIMDLGTGEGAFLKKLAMLHPEIQFFGVESKEHLIAKARLDSAPNIKWIHDNAFSDAVQRDLRTADGVLMRYFILHLPKTKAALPVLLDGLKPGARLFVFDIDIGNCKCEPSSAAFDSFTDLVQTFCDENNVEIQTARALPPILKTAGFEVCNVTVEPFNTKEVDRSVLGKYMMREAILYAHHLTGHSRSNRLDEIKKFLLFEMQQEKHLVQYGMTMISAAKPMPRL